MRQTTRAVMSTSVENRSLWVYWCLAVSANSWSRSSGRRAYSSVPRSMTVRGLPSAKRSKIFPRSMARLLARMGVQVHHAYRVGTMAPTFKGMGFDRLRGGGRGGQVAGANRQHVQEVGEAGQVQGAAQVLGHA